MKCAVGHCGHCQFGPEFVCRDGPVFDRAPRARSAERSGSCDGRRRCQSSRSGSSPPATAASSACSTARTSCSALSEQIEIAYFLEASSAHGRRARTTSRWSRARSRRPTTRERIQQVRASSRHLVTIGACATAGGIQALRNFGDVDEFVSAVYATPQFISTLDSSTPISAHVPVDFELRGCPINKQQLLEVIGAFLNRRKPAIAEHSVCVECKRRGTVCVMVAHGTPCLGPVTHAGCGAICPAYARGCYGCYGPMETPNTAALSGAVEAARRGASRTSCAPFAASTPISDEFRDESEKHEEERGRRRLRTAPHQDGAHRLPGAGRGRGLDVRQGRGRRGHGREALDLRAAALLRGVPARPQLHRGARHHGAHLRHLPGRLPDERGGGDGGRLRRRGRRSAARPAPADLLRRVDREPHAARLHAARARLPRLLERDRDGQGPSRGGRDGPADEEDRQRADRSGRRPRGASDQRARRRLLQGARSRASSAPMRERLERAREWALEAVRWVVDARFPRLRARHRGRVAALSRASIRSIAGGPSRTAGSTSRRRSSSITSRSSRSSTRTRCSRSCASATPT